MLIISCNNKYRVQFDFLIIILAIYDCFMIPVQISMGDILFGEQVHGGLNILSYLVDIIFCFDIVLNFFTTYINQKTGLEVTKHKEIAKEYLKSSFTADLLGAIPFEVFFYIFSSIGMSERETEANIKNLRVISILKLTRLVRLSKIIMFLNILKSDFKFGVRIILILVGFMMSIHWIICIKYLLIIDDFQQRP